MTTLVVFIFVVLVFVSAIVYWRTHRIAIKAWRKRNMDEVKCRVARPETTPPLPTTNTSPRHGEPYQIQTVADTVTVVWVCMQTIILISLNHSAQGGQEFPVIYAEVSGEL